MKLIVRIDDTEYTGVNGIEAFETIDHGASTSSDVMPEPPGSETMILS